MNMKLVRGYFLAILGLLILVAAGILLLSNIGGEWPMHFFWKPITLRPVVGMLLIGAAGVVVWYTVIRLLPSAVTTLRKGKSLQQAKEDRQRINDLEKEKSEGEDEQKQISDNSEKSE